MKIKSEIYAQTLIDAISENKMTKENIAKYFWYSLQRNGQYKNFYDILDRLNQVYADKTGSIFAQVCSVKTLEENELIKIKQKLEIKYKKKIILENIIRKNMIAGFIVKIEDTEIDLSLKGKITRLKQLLKSYDGEIKR